MTSKNEPTPGYSGVQGDAAIPPYLVLLRINEYHTLLRKGMLHAIAPERVVKGESVEGYSAWTDAFPAGKDESTVWVLLPAFTNVLPLDISQVDINLIYSISEQEAESIQRRTGGLKTNGFPLWLQGVWDAINKARWLLSNYPHGVLVVPRSGRERPEIADLLPYSASSYLSPVRLGDAAAWAAALPDIEDDEYAVILPLTRSIVPSPIPREYLKDKVMPISERGRTLLIEHAGYPAGMLTSPGFQKIIPEVLEKRQLDESAANGNRLAGTVSLKPADTNRFEKMKPAIRVAVQNRFRIEAGKPGPSLTFWDYLMAYDRTGEHAEKAESNSRGFLYDIYAVARGYFDDRKNRGELSDSDRAGIREEFGAWGTMVNDPSLNNTAYQAVVPKSKSTVNSLVARLNSRLNSEKEYVLAVAYFYLDLRRFMGDNEGDFSAQHLESYRKFAAQNKLELELAMALYAIGSYLPASRFMDIYRGAVRTLSSAAVKSRTRGRGGKAAAVVSSRPPQVSFVDDTTSAIPAESVVSTPPVANIETVAILPHQQEIFESGEQFEMALKPKTEEGDSHRIV